MNLILLVFVVNIIFWTVIAIYFYNRSADSARRSDSTCVEVSNNKDITRENNVAGRAAAWVISKIPPQLLNIGAAVIVYVFFTRNCIFQVLYILLVVTGHVVVINDGLLIMRHYDPETSHLFWPLTLVTVNFIVFVYCCYCDPGELNKDNLQSISSMYAYDEIMYKSDAKCDTCNLVKPARSKHCSVYNRCIYKFDHYCIWIRNVVGGNNHRYFLLLLFSLVVMCVHGAYATGKVLHAWSDSKGMRKMRYVDKTTGEPVELSTYTFILVLARDFPRLMFIEMSLIVLACIVGSFLVYHCYLAVTNQTTNERYKVHSLRKQKIAVSNSFYSRNIVENILEEIFPLRSVRHKID